MQFLNQEFGDHIPLFLKNIIIGAAAVFLGLLIKFILHKFFLQFSKWWSSSLIKFVIKRLQHPVAIFIPLLLFNFSLQFMLLTPMEKQILLKTVEISITINFAFILIRLVYLLEDYFFLQFPVNKDDNLKERTIQTQFYFVKRFIFAVIVLVTIAIILLSFDSMRKLGAGLLTGAGIGGIIIGFAAQKSLGNLLAGFQIAFTQPLRIDDVLVVEGEWGKVEEITLTYVVLNIWDQRRLILPITYFIEKPFQNWTRVSAQLLGTIFLYLDFEVPIEPLRTEFTKFLDSNALWDKRVNAVQVTDTNKEGSIEVRFLMSATNSSRAFDLRCEAREAMITFIQKNHPQGLPKRRLDFKEGTWGNVKGLS